MNVLRVTVVLFAVILMVTPVFAGGYNRYVDEDPFEYDEREDQLSAGELLLGLIIFLGLAYFCAEYNYDPLVMLLLTPVLLTVVYYILSLF